MSECDGQMIFRLRFEEAIFGCRGLRQTREHASSKEAAAIPEKLILAMENLGFGVIRIF